MTYSGTDTRRVSMMSRRQVLDLLSGPDGRLSRDVLLEFASETPLESLNLNFKSGQIGVLWDEVDLRDGRAPPLVFVIADEDYVDFIAWCTTYVGTYSPISAFFRIVQASWIERFELFSERRPLISEEVLERLSSVCIAEAALQTSFRESRIDRISFQSCLHTFSYSAMSGLWTGLHPAQILDLEETWASVRGGVSERNLKVEPQRIATFWLLACNALLDEGASSSSSEWISLIGKLVAGAAPGHSDSARLDWGEFKEVETSIREFDEVVTLPRDRQIKALDAAFRRFSDLSYPEPLLEAVLGFLTARLGNGSFDYLGLTSEYQGRFPGTALWFAYFCIWQPGFDALSAGGGLGRRIASNLARKADVLTVPSSDISYDELRIIMQTKRSQTFRTRNSSVLEVELVPNVSGFFPNPFRRPSEDVRLPYEIDTKRISRLLREALSVVERGDFQSESTVQGNLFQSESPKKSSKINKRR